MKVFIYWLHDSQLNFNLFITVSDELVWWYKCQVLVSGCMYVEIRVPTGQGKWFLKITCRENSGNLKFWSGKIQGILFGCRANTDLQLWYDLLTSCASRVTSAEHLAVLDLNGHPIAPERLKTTTGDWKTTVQLPDWQPFFKINNYSIRNKACSLVRTYWE